MPLTLCLHLLCSSASSERQRPLVCSSQACWHGCRYNFHPGSTCGKWSTEEGIAQIAALVNRALAATSSVTIVLENTAGQGSCIGHRFEQLADIIDQVTQAARYLSSCIPCSFMRMYGNDSQTISAAAQKHRAGLRLALLYSGIMQLYFEIVVPQASFKLWCHPVVLWCHLVKRCVKIWPLDEAFKLCMMSSCQLRKVPVHC